MKRLKRKEQNKINKIVYENFHNEYICAYCGHKIMKKYMKDRLTYNKKKYRLATIDHIIPLSKGGTNDIYNLAPCCYHCNQLKLDLLPHELLRRYTKEFPNGFHYQKKVLYYLKPHQRQELKKFLLDYAKKDLDFLDLELFSNQ